jgi:hypothetical protein
LKHAQEVTWFKSAQKDSFPEGGDESAPIGLKNASMSAQMISCKVVVSIEWAVLCVSVLWHCVMLNAPPFALHFILLRLTALHCTARCCVAKYCMQHIHGEENVENIRAPLNLSINYPSYVSGNMSVSMLFYSSPITLTQCAPHHTTYSQRESSSN